MAEPHAAPDHAHASPSMEIVEQRSTYHAFDGLVRWGSLAVAALILFLTLMFCTGAGFFGAAVPAAILVAVGVFALRKAPTSIDAH